MLFSEIIILLRKLILCFPPSVTGEVYCFPRRQLIFHFPYIIRKVFESTFRNQFFCLSLPWSSNELLDFVFFLNLWCYTLMKITSVAINLNQILHIMKITSVAINLNQIYIALLLVVNCKFDIIIDWTLWTPCNYMT